MYTQSVISAIIGQKKEPVREMVLWPIESSQRKSWIIRGLFFEKKLQGAVGFRPSNSFSEFHAPTLNLTLDVLPLARLAIRLLYH